MKELFELSKNMSETLRAWGDATLLPILCVLIISMSTEPSY